MDHDHDIPTVRLRTGGRIALASVAMTSLLGWALYRVFSANSALHGRDNNVLLWTALFLAAGHQVLLAWRDKPFTATDEQQAELDRLHLSVNVPLYNESPEIVDRVMFALHRQSRLPQRIDVVDDGSRAEYRAAYEEIRDHWAPLFTAAGVVFSWTRQANAGKRHAQAVTFVDAPDGIVVTLDSDTALERGALAEVLKPFADPRVFSVAGVEIAFNARRNLLTRINTLRQITWQLVQCSALNRRGQMLVNRGTFAAYRTVVVQERLAAYLGETFMGKPVKYSDDSLLTLYALSHGRAVQQLTAFQLPEYPEYVSHALRQWARWMRGSTIRSLWRAKYLPVGSYGWFMNTLSWWQFVTASMAYLYVWAFLPAEGRFGLASVAIAVACTYLMPLRALLIDRSDETSVQQLDTFLLAPLSWAWSLLVLRPLRLYGALTCANNGWGTRSAVEVGFARDHGVMALDPLADTAVAAASTDTLTLPPVGARVRHRRRRGWLHPLHLTAFGTVTATGACAAVVLLAGGTPSPARYAPGPRAVASPSPSVGTISLPAATPTPGSGGQVPVAAVRSLAPAPTTPAPSPVLAASSAPASPAPSSTTRPASPSPTRTPSAPPPASPSSPSAAPTPSASSIPTTPPSTPPSSTATTPEDGPTS